jgi:hypothetical protein
MKSASGSHGLTIAVTSSGTRTNSLNIEQFMHQVHEFPHQGGAKETFKLKAVPYEDIVANWPPRNPLAPITDADKLDALAKAAYGFEALIDDSTFVVQNAKLFALGVTKREARLGYMKARRNFYQAELDGMRKSAKNCDVDWKGTPGCEPLYAKWKGFDDFAVAEYDQFPVQYVADCSATREVNMESKLGIEVGKNLLLNHTKGDEDFGGGPGLFSAYLNIAPEYTGGDRLAVRKLDANLHMQVMEGKADESTFEQTVKASGVVDLSDPTMSSTPLDQCSYRGSGVKVTQIKVDSAFCQSLKKIIGEHATSALEMCNKKVGSPYEGMIHGQTGMNPPSFTFNKNTRGILSSISCDFSAAGHGKVSCNNVKLLSTQLDLVNARDLDADAWVAPKDANAQATPKGQNPNPKRSKALSALLASKAKPQAAKSCKAGFTSEHGACVPQLKH